MSTTQEDPNEVYTYEEEEEIEVTDDEEPGSATEDSPEGEPESEPAPVVPSPRTPGKVKASDEVKKMSMGTPESVAKGKQHVSPFRTQGHVVFPHGPGESWTDRYEA